MSRRLGDFEALSFDCYGTLIDWETGIWDALQPLWSQQGATGGGVSRREALQLYARLESAAEAEQPGAPYPEILRRVHRGLAEALGFDRSDELDADFAASIAHWPAFADSAEALRELAKRYKLIILSNVDRAGIAASQRKLGVTFDAVCTAEEIGSYKPARANFDHLLHRLDTDFGIASERLLHTAQSLYHDHVPAQAIGLASAWIDRQNLRASGDWGATAPVDERPDVDFVFASLAEMAAAAKG